MHYKKILLVVIAALVATMLSSCGYNVPPDMVAIHIGEGPFEAKKLKGECIEPSKRAWMTNDTYYLVPTNEREWDATGQDGSDGGKFKSVTKDSVEMQTPVTIRFTINTECDQLKDFYTKYLRRNGVEFESDGGYNDQWITTLRKLVADPADATLDRILQDYGWREVWNDPTVKVEIEKRFNESLASDSSLLVQTAKGQFFEGISVLVGKPEPVNKDLAAAVATEQTKVAEAKSAEAQAAADQKKAEAQIAVNKAEASKKRADIMGYMLPGMSPKDAIRAYNEAQCIEKNCNPYQPTYIVGGTR